MYELLLDGAIVLGIEYFHVSQLGATAGHMMEDVLTFMLADAAYIYLLKGMVLPNIPVIKDAYWTQLLGKVLVVGLGDWGIHKGFEGRPNLKKSMIKAASVTGIDAIVAYAYPKIMPLTTQPGSMG